jgi:hypothetical protein
MTGSKLGDQVFITRDFGGTFYIQTIQKVIKIAHKEEKDHAHSGM